MYVINWGHLTLIGVYGPEKRKTEETVGFFCTLQKVLNKILKTEYACLYGDFNARIGYGQLSEQKREGIKTICIFESINYDEHLFRKERYP